MTKIPVHQLKERTSLRLHLKRFDKGVFSEDEEKVFGVHRDNHYIFFVLEKGDASVNIDFEDVLLPGRSLYYVLPGQVHQHIVTQGADGWFVAADTALVPAECRRIFEANLFLQQPFSLNDTQLQQCSGLLNLLFEKYREHDNQTFEVMAIRGYDYCISDHRTDRHDHSQCLNQHHERESRRFTRGYRLGDNFLCDC
ncbi:hypothetical protein [Pararcticibacter amylolyticus]|uniref:hypothetical protein n=1 Tax=Pararcticibacter amylolyticus TaxID=2173175 RepID=UPI001EE4CBE1|nr:hypothetical protein [Pararcticibacter amylolyticus]